MPKILTTADKQRIVLDKLAVGWSIVRACDAAGVSDKTFEYWKYHATGKNGALPAKQFSAEVEHIRIRQAGGRPTEVPQFEDFSAIYMGNRLFAHHLQWLDILEGNEPRNLHPAQTYVKGHPNLLLINTPPHHAKALDVSTPIPTPKGWTTMGALSVGEEVFGRDGIPCRVIVKSEVFHKPTYRVTFADGSSIVATDDHNWLVRSRDGYDTVRTTAFLAEHLRAAGRFVYRVPVAEPVQYSAKELPVDPYLLGCWLGDGTSRGGSITGVDPEIFEAFEARYESGFTDGITRGFKGLLKPLRLLGVLGNKHIPEDYMLGSVDQRMALLQGLMDTDGTAGSRDRQASFTNKNQLLAAQTLELVRGLGFKARISQMRATFKGVDFGPCWRVYFMSGNRRVFRLARKYSLQKPGTEQNKWNTIHNVELIETRAAQCITVDSEDHLYLAGRSYTVTHNSEMFCQNYITWRIVQDPNVRVLLVSASADRAKKNLDGIKNRLDKDVMVYQDLKRDFAPSEGYNNSAARWQADMILVNPDLRDRNTSGHPTVQALGVRKKIYGARADIIILDDCCDLDNAHEFPKQIEWIQGIINTRLEPGTGKLIIVGTRLAAQDLYSEIMKPEWYVNGEAPYTYLTQPAVLQMENDPKDWITLWPKTNVQPAGLVKVEPDAHGFYPMWDGPALAEKRNNMSAEMWARVYQQQQVSQHTTFTQSEIDGCTNGLRFAGPMVAGQRGHRPEGMAGLYVVAGLDPAATNFTAMVVVGADLSSGRRYVLDVWNQHGALPAQTSAVMKEWTKRYGVAEWRIETNAYQASILQDDELRTWMSARGVRMSAHTTGRNKWDAQWGVATMANLFKGYEHAYNALELPSRKGHAGVQSLVEQLIAWYPTPSMTKAPVQDCVMALWFAEIRCRELLDQTESSSHWDDGFTSPRDREEQVVINIDWYAASQGGFSEPPEREGPVINNSRWWEQQ